MSIFFLVMYQGDKNRAKRVKKDWIRFDVNSVGENSFDGYLLEVDLEYLDKLHELYNDYL